MAHFAKLDDNNIVIDVNVVNNSDIQDLAYPASEPVGIAFLTEWSGGYTKWKQTSYNKNFRGNFAGIGYVYDTTNDVFYAPQPFPSWTLNTTNWTWQSPIPYPNDENRYSWDETTQSWIKQ